MLCINCNGTGCFYFVAVCHRVKVIFVLFSPPARKCAKPDWRYFVLALLFPKTCAIAWPMRHINREQIQTRTPVRHTNYAEINKDHFSSRAFHKYKKNSINRTKQNCRFLAGLIISGEQVNAERERKKNLARDRKVHLKN